MITTEILRFALIFFGLAIAVVVLVLAFFVPDLIESIKALYDALSD